MNIMCLDLEMDQPSGAIIQVGAVVFSRQGDVLAKFKKYVKAPTPINPYIIELTGITNEQVESGEPITKVYQDLGSLHKSFKCFKNGVVWGSGTHNDADTLWKQSGSKEPNFMGLRVLDAKTLFQSRQLICNSTIKANLSESMRKLGLTFQGREHDALDDAYNTGLIWFYLARMMQP